MERTLVQLSREFQEMELEQLRKGELEARKKLEKAKGWFSRTRDELTRQIERAGRVSDQAWAETRETLETAAEEFRSTVERSKREFAGEDTTKAVPASD